jgi:hypothetical protein
MSETANKKILESRKITAHLSIILTPFRLSCQTYRNENADIMATGLLSV